MNIVEPIRSANQIIQIRGNLYRQESPRDFLLFVFGINSGLRIGDLLSLKLADVKNGQGNLRDYLTIKEQKTGKTRKVHFNSQIKEALNHYLKKTGIFNLDQYLFTNEKSKKNKPITRVRAYQLINEWCRTVGIRHKVGGHTLRKTFGYHLRMQGISIERISSLLNHRNIGVTFRYIGIDDDENKEVINGFGI
ncbi:site-specific integrase [Candidatus Atribacteria bacterium 1244-E10-H5-B2]|nr:MAG: site-specific integrase [Candidatus Atribacteria bacterium 1244-E10-H5-B2]